MADPWAWRSDMNAPQPSAVATLKPGPAPTGRDKVFDSIYGWLGGLPQNRSTASALTNLFDVATLGMATGAYDGSKDLAQTGQPAALAMALMPGAKVASPLAKVGEKAVERGIRAFHGSPHDFNKFSLDKIGTGEGAQAYGHGLYFAENKNVAGYYKKPVKQFADPNEAATYLAKQSGWDGPIRYDKDTSAVYAVDRAGGWLSRKKERFLGNVRGRSGSHTVAFKEEDGNKGRMYEVNINADPADFLDWDKPLSQQSDKVRSAISKITAEKGGAVQDPATTTGADLYTGMNNAHEVLRANGVPGIRYLDQLSRASGEGTRNTVVFDDSLIEILRKYGLLPPAAAGAVAASESDPAQAAP